MEYVLTENNYNKQYGDFIVELQGAELNEYFENNIDNIIKKNKN